MIRGHNKTVRSQAGHTSWKYQMEFDNYGSHIYVFEKIFTTFKIKNVLEFGLGSHSTTYFAKRAQLVVSVEQERRDWYDKMVAQVRLPNWQPVFQADAGAVFRYFDEKNIRLSLFNKIIQYTWWTRRMFVESNRERSLESNYQLNSRLIKMIREILYLSDGFDVYSSAKGTVRYFLRKYSGLLSFEERLILIDLVNMFNISKNVANMSDDYFEIRFSIINKIHKEAISLLVRWRSGVRVDLGSSHAVYFYIYFEIRMGCRLGVQLG